MSWWNRRKRTGPVSGTLTRVFLPVIPVDWFVKGAKILAFFVFLIISSYFVWFIFFQSSEIGGPETWGQFGDFVGGLLNPILAFFTIVLFALTLLKQQEELHRMISMNEVERLFRITEKVYEELDETLNEKIRVGVQDYDRRVNLSGADFSNVLRPEVVREKLNIKAVGFPKSLASRKELEAATRASGISEWDFQLNGVLGRVFDLVRELDKYCGRIASITQSSEVSEFYSNRLKQMIFAIAVKGYMPINDLGNLFVERSISVTSGDKVEVWKLNENFKMELWHEFQDENSKGQKWVETF